MNGAGMDGAGINEVEMNRLHGKSMRGISLTAFEHTLTLLMAALREIFDEAAYARFLNRKQMTASRETYAAFCRECDGAKARRPRCC
ncbi:MAG TPA: hypothetical protein VHS34_04305 [Terriglobales bacterium]|jgi:truncated hemoglobin YjbI|nr:hypothetical protein [Terriglobales bacterium]